jgi:hypothetical protein
MSENNLLIAALSSLDENESNVLTDNQVIQNETAQGPLVIL